MRMRMMIVFLSMMGFVQAQGLIKGTGTKGNRTSVVKSDIQLYNKLKKVVLPSVTLKEASLKSTLDFLRAQSRKHTGKAFNVLYLCKKETRDVLLTIDVEDVPISEVLYYITQMAPVEIMYEEHAILVKDKAKKDKK